MADTGGSFSESWNLTIEERIRNHLTNVYSCIAFSTFCSMIGGHIHLATLYSPDLFTILLPVIIIFILGFTRTNEFNPFRFFAYVVFSILTGLNTGPLIASALEVDPAIIPRFFFMTSLIFLCFTFVALHAPKRKFLYLGGVLIAGIVVVLTLSLANLFVGSMLIYDIIIYTGLLLEAGFILYDTHLIMARCAQNDTDIIWHSLCLYLDFFGLFQKLISMLINRFHEARRNQTQVQPSIG